MVKNLLATKNVMRILPIIDLKLVDVVVEIVLEAQLFIMKMNPIYGASQDSQMGGQSR